MKRLMITLFCTLLAFAGRATAQTLTMTADDVTIVAGSTAELKVSLENSMEVAGWQLFLYLPEHIDIAFEEEDGERYYNNTVVLSSRHLPSHTCTVTATTDGGYLIMGYNPSKPTNIKDYSGKLVSITLKASDAFDGEHTGIIKKAAISDIYAVQANIENDMIFQISVPITNGISNATGDSTEDTDYRINGQRAQKADKGVLIRNRQKHIVK